MPNWQVFGTLAAGNQPLSLFDTLTAQIAVNVNAKCGCAGTNALTLTPDATNGPAIPAYVTGMTFAFIAANTSTNVLTAQVGSLASLKVFRPDGVTQANAGDILINRQYYLQYNAALDAGAGGFVIVNLITGTSGHVVMYLDGQNVWSAQQSSAVATLTDAANIAWDVSTRQKAKVVLGGNRTMNATTNAVEGTTYYLWVIQDGTGGRTMTWTGGAGGFDFGATGAPTLTATANAADLLCFEAITIGGTLKLRYMGIAKGFT